MNSRLSTPIRQRWIWAEILRSSWLRGGRVAASTGTATRLAEPGRRFPRLGEDVNGVRRVAEDLSCGTIAWLTIPALSLE